MTPARPWPPPAAALVTDLDVARVQTYACARIERALRARGLPASDDTDPELLEGYEGSALRELWSESLLSQTVAGDDVVQEVPRLVEPEVASAKHEALEPPRGALIASSNGYSLHAATRIEADDRAALERLIRSMARPPLAQDRLMLREDGKVLWNLRRPWRGTRALVFDPLTFIGRHAAGSTSKRPVGSFRSCCGRPRLTFPTSENISSLPWLLVS